MGVAHCYKIESVGVADSKMLKVNFERRVTFLCSIFASANISLVLSFVHVCSDFYRLPFVCSSARKGSQQNWLWFAGMAMAVALQAERSVIEKKKPDIKQRRVVVTGMGVVTPLGHDPDVFYNNLLDGVSGISEIERFDCSNFPTVIHCT